MKKEKGKKVQIKCHATINGELKPENIKFGSYTRKRMGWE